MSESQHAHRARREEDQTEVQQTAAVTPQGTDDELDSLLDEIDGVLEVNAEEFVRSFVQKGGQ